MKKFILSMICGLFILSSCALAEEPKEVGKASAESVRAAKSNNWRGWAFAAFAVAATAVGLTIIARHQGAHAHH